LNRVAVAQQLKRSGFEQGLIHLLTCSKPGRPDRKKVKKMTKLKSAVQNRQKVLPNELAEQCERLYHVLMAGLGNKEIERWCRHKIRRIEIQIAKLSTRFECYPVPQSKPNDDLVNRIKRCWNWCLVVRQILITATQSHEVRLQLPIEDDRKDNLKSQQNNKNDWLKSVRQYSKISPKPSIGDVGPKGKEFSFICSKKILCATLGVSYKTLNTILESHGFKRYNRQTYQICIDKMPEQMKEKLKKT
jgi:hypothetical protein